VSDEENDRGGEAAEEESKGADRGSRFGRCEGAGAGDGGAEGGAGTAGADQVFVAEPGEEEKLIYRERDQFGRFRPGFSGNGAGRPIVLADVVAAAKERSLRAVAVLAEIMEDPGQHPYARSRAASSLLAIAFGKAGVSAVEPVEVAAAVVEAVGGVARLSDGELVALFLSGGGVVSDLVADDSEA